MINIALIDDESLFLEGFSLLFSKLDDMRVTKVANGGHEFLHLLQGCPKAEFPDIALVDIQMKPMDGFELIDLLNVKYPELKIMVLSSHYKSNVISHMIKLGISAFIPKNINKQTLLETIDSVNSSGVYLSQADQSHFSKNSNSRSFIIPRMAGAELSDIEKDVIRLICDEVSSQDIAKHLHLGEHTLEHYREDILNKVGARNTIGLKVYAIINGLHSINV